MRAIAFVALLLTACDDMPATRTKSEIRSIAEDEADAAADRQAALSDEKIARLNDRVEQLEADKRQLENQVVVLQARQDNDDTNIKTLFKNDRIFGDRLGYPPPKP